MMTLAPSSVGTATGERQGRIRNPDAIFLLVVALAGCGGPAPPPGHIAQQAYVKPAAYQLRPAAGVLPPVFSPNSWICSVTYCVPPAKPWQLVMHSLTPQE